MSTKRNLQKSSVTARLLKDLVDELDLLMTFGYRPSMFLTFSIDGIRKMRSIKERKYLKERIDRLKAKKLIELKQTGDRYRIALTQDGATQYFRLKVHDSELLNDSSVCMVVFDIPESQATLRKVLRNFLKDAGFMNIQKSVWISPFDASEALKRLFDSAGASKWVRIYKAIEIL